MQVAFNPSFRGAPKPTPLERTIKRTLNARNGGKIQVTISSPKVGSYNAEYIVTDAKDRIVSVCNERQMNSVSKKDYLEGALMFIEKLKAICGDSPLLKELDEFFAGMLLK